MRETKLNGKPIVGRGEVRRQTREEVADYLVTRNLRSLRRGVFGAEVW